MEIDIDRDELYKKVSRVQSIIERRSNMPILSTILLSAGGSKVTMSATDLELGFQQTIPAEIKKDGNIAVSGRKLFEILKESRRSQFHIQEKDNNRVFISDGAARFDLACLPADEYPGFVEPEGVVMVNVDADLLNEMINKTIYSVTMEEAGFKLSGIFTEKVAQKGSNFLRMVSTDGHRLSLIDKALPGIEGLELGKGVMIPKKGMAELNKLAAEGGSLQLGFKEKNCVVRKDDVLLVVRLLESKFPDYHAVIPQQEKDTVSVDRTALLESMRKMLILTNERYRAVKITLENDTMELISTNPDLGEAQESISVSYRSDRLEVGFNPRYFIDALQAMESDKVDMGFIDNSRPCILRGDADQGFLGLIMPMRV